MDEAGFENWATRTRRGELEEEERLRKGEGSQGRGAQKE